MVMIAADDSQKVGSIAMAYGISIVEGIGFRARKTGIKTAFRRSFKPTRVPVLMPSSTETATEGKSSFNELTMLRPKIERDFIAARAILLKFGKMRVVFVPAKMPYSTISTTKISADAQ
jgi:hypothetical protein